MKIQYLYIFLFNLIFYSIFLSNLEFFLKKFNIFDVPNLRKIHNKKTSLAGGTIIFFCVISNLFFLYFIGYKKEILDFFDLTNSKFFTFLIINFLLFYLLGLYDDKYNLKNFKKSFFLFLLSYFFVSVNEAYQIKNILFSNNFNITLEKASVFFTALSLLILITIMNLYDGINLQSGLFYFLNYLLFFLLTKKILFLVLLFSLVFFLYLNFKNKCFLGDSGVNFLAFLYGVILLKLYVLIDYWETPIIYYDEILLLCFLPLLDSFRLLIFRLLKHGDPLKADKRHFHHLIYNRNSILITNLKSLSFLIVSTLIIYFNVNTIFGFFVNFLLYYFFLWKKISFPFFRKKIKIKSI